MIARSLHVLMRNLIITNTKHIMNKNISIFLLQLVEMIPPKSEPLNSFMLFILFLCGFGPSNEKFFIVSVDKNSGNTIHLILRQKVGKVFIIDIEWHVACLL